MAIDTRDKRASAGGLHWDFVAPDPDGSFNQGDRQQYGGTYRGILAISISWVEVGIPFLYTSANWVGETFYFEAYIRATSGTAQARLFNKSKGVSVAGSNLSETSSSFTRNRSGSIVLADDDEFVAQFGTASGDSGEGKGAKVIGVLS